MFFGLRQRRRRDPLRGVSDQLWKHGGRSAFAWRLDLPADRNDRGMFLPGHGENGGRQRGRLMHYISAGGMRQLRVRRGDRGGAAHVERMQRLLAALALLWVIFRFVRCL